MFAAHTYNEAFRLLGSHPRLIRPVEQVFCEKLYMHQYKINAKAAFEGDVWQWHQDYGTWARDDGMPEPRAMNIAVFVDEVMPINGPLMLVPRSHSTASCRRGTMWKRPPIRCGRSTTRQWHDWSTRAASLRRPGGRVGC